MIPTSRWRDIRRWFTNIPSRIHCLFAGHEQPPFADVEWCPRCGWELGEYRGRHVHWLPQVDVPEDYPLPNMSLSPPAPAVDDGLEWEQLRENLVNAIDWRYVSNPAIRERIADAMLPVVDAYAERFAAQRCRDMGHQQ